MGVEGAGGDASDDVVEAAVGGVLGDEAVDEALAGERQHLVAGLLAAVRFALAALLDVRAVLLEGVDESIDALLLRRGPGASVTDWTHDGPGRLGNAYFLLSSAREPDSVLRIA